MKHWKIVTAELLELSITKHKRQKVPDKEQKVQLNKHSEALHLSVTIMSNIWMENNSFTWMKNEESQLSMKIIQWQIISTNGSSGSTQ
jgi:hypothetical protein